MRKRIGLSGVLLACLAVAGGTWADAFPSVVERDWLFQERWRRNVEITPATDAAGGCDGIIDGRYGFHTGAADQPWWQVDLGAVQALTQAVVWNRCDTAERANGLEILLSEDGGTWRSVYRHGETPFFGFTDNKPLRVALPGGTSARFVRVVFHASQFAHLDEVQVIGGDGETNLALHAPATQVSTSQWSTYSVPEAEYAITKTRVAEVVADARGLATASAPSTRLDEQRARLDAVNHSLSGDPTPEELRQQYLEARWIQRELTLARPELDFASLLLTKRVPGSFSHMSDQYYGWWSRPGGGIYRIDGFRENAPQATCLTDAFTEEGSFLRPTLSYDGQRVLFAWCRYYPGLAEEPDKLNKANVPENAFYHVFEMNIDGSGVRQLSRGKYDDFDARYLPDGRIVFLSTRRGQSLQAGRDTARLTLAKDDRPDCYVRCGGGPERPVAVYTLHRMDADGGGMVALSPFEMFEWTPAIAHDGTILYSRWDYVDRWNMPWMSLWKIHPDGTNAHLVYGNYSNAPHCTFEPQAIPGSDKIIFTASGHHAQTMGSLVLLDPRDGLEGEIPLRRLTPEVCFPEIEGWPGTFYATPWPLSERFHLVTWGRQASAHQGTQRPPNGMSLYLFDTEGNMELLYTDPEINVESPIPLRPRPRPPMLADTVRWEDTEEGCFFVADVYEGLKNTPRGTIKRLRVVAVPVKTQPAMDTPSLGLTRDDPGKCVLGSVPVEEDGSVFFRLPAGVSVFLQLLDAEDIAVQTMRSATHVQPGQTLGCVGCHEPRVSAPPLARPLASLAEPARLTLPPSGAWPYRFDQLVQPALERECVSCHRANGEDPRAASLDLTAGHAYDALTACGNPSLREQVMARYLAGASEEGQGVAATSAVLTALGDPERHPDLVVTRDTMTRLCLWMDTYAQRTGFFSPEQEREHEQLRERWAGMFLPAKTDKVARRQP